MVAYYFLINSFNLRLLFILVGALVIKCEALDHLFPNTGGYSCPFIETLSFGSDIDIKCNNTYLIFNEINNKELNWKFANQDSYCQKKGKVEGFVNQCNITQINSKYLKVLLKYSTHNEYACVYCPINYKRIAPIITVTQSDAGVPILYTFNLTATGLDRNESFEILWAKRVNIKLVYSLNYWFLQRCVARDIKTLRNTGHSILFTVEDTDISRVEFIIRRCNGPCRVYHRCSDEQFSTEASSTTFQIPDSIEKISCNDDCLNGIIPFLLPITTMNNPIKEHVLSTTIQLSKEKQPTKFLILFSILAFLIVLLFIMLGLLRDYLGLRADNIYTKTSNINLDENKETME